MTCTITNDDVAPKLTLKKHVVNNDGGTSAASDWSMHVKGGDPIADVAGSPADGTETGTTYTLKAGDYAVSETDGPSGYTQTGISGACDESGDVTLAVGDDVTCTITNDDVAPKLTLKKHVVNNNGGTATAGQWTMHIKAGGNDVVGKSPFAGAEDPGTTRSLNAGSYDVSESGGPSGYTQTSIGGDCSANGSVTLAVGDEKTCTITNDDISPTLTVNKVLVPADDGGKFNLLIDGAAAGTGANVGNGGTTGAVPVNAGSHTVGETAGTGTNLSDYVPVIGGACSANGSVSLAVGENKTCTITNQRLPRLTVVKHDQQRRPGPGERLEHLRF